MIERGNFKLTKIAVQPYRPIVNHLLEALVVLDLVRVSP